MNRYKLLIIVFLLTVAAMLTTLFCNGQTRKGHIYKTGTNQPARQPKKWEPNPKYIKGSTTEQAAKFQCNGTTQKGQRCKRKVATDGGFCYQHANQQ